MPVSQNITKPEFRTFVARWFRRSKRDGGSPIPEAALARLPSDEVEALRSVTEDQFQVIRRLFTQSRTNAETLDANSWVSDRAFQLWALRALRTEVEMRANGLALLRHPEDGFTVQIEWLWDHKDKTHKPSKLHVIADEELHIGDCADLEDYFAAFFVHAASRSFPKVRAPRKRPDAGKPLDPDFYRRLLQNYDQLVAEGYKAPAAELARLLGENRSTVKSWLHRGRKYLGKEG